MGSLLKHGLGLAGLHAGEGGHISGMTSAPLSPCYNKLSVASLLNLPLVIPRVGPRTQPALTTRSYLISSAVTLKG